MGAGGWLRGSPSPGWAFCFENFKKAFINPEIIEETGSPWIYEEGCLSIPNIRENVSRKDKVLIRYFDEKWEEHEEEYTGIQARIIQHEYDHIEGKLFIDYLTPLKKRLLKGKLADISKGKVNTEFPAKDIFVVQGKHLQAGVGMTWK